MKKLSVFLLFLISAATLSSQSYRYLKVETIRCDNHKWQELEWLVGEVAHPVIKMTSATSNGMVASGDVGGSEIYRPYDGDPATHAWLGYITPPEASKSITLDLGAGNEIDPDHLRITKPTYSYVMDFRIWASNDQQDWALLLDTVGLESGGFATMEFLLEEIVDTEAPTTPSNLQLISATTSTISLQWDASSDDRSVSGYDVYLDDVYHGTTDLTNYLVTDLDEGTSYDIHVVAFDEASNRSGSSDVLAVQTKIPDLDPPSDPVNLVFDSAHYNTLWFSWDASTDNEMVAGYLVYLDGTISGVAGTNSFALTGLDPGTEYSVEISARDASGNISAGAVQGTFSTTTDIPEKMLIGTNFWNIGWGGFPNDPFVDSYQDVSIVENPWKPEFLAETDFYSHFRFMDYLETNGSDLSHWLDRAQKSDLNQRPMAFEWMINMCNIQDADLWITVPHLVVSRNGIEGGDNHFMKKLAILVKTGVDMAGADLDDPAFEDLAMMTEAELLALGGVKTCDPLEPHLNFYLEYSNETWNGSFEQFNYCVQEGTALGLEGDTYAQGRRFHAWAAIRLFEDAAEVFGPGNPRIVRIDAYQAVVPSQIIDHYSVYKDETLNPLGLFPDAFAPAPYFGNGVNGGSSGAVNALINGDNGILSRTRALKTARGFLDNERNNGYPVDKLIAYEGGQHVTTNAQIISRNPEIYTLYVRYLDSCSAYLDEMSHYLHSGTFGSGGAWGSKESIGQDIRDAHKYRALFEWNAGIATRPDSEKPTPPETLTSTDVSEQGYTLHWTPGTDNHKVTGYIVNVDEQTITDISDTLVEVTGLEPGRTYVNTVQTVDSTGNVSDNSAPLEVTTSGTATFTVTFEVKDATDNSPVVNATVTFDESVKTTDNQGMAVYTEQDAGTGFVYTLKHADYQEVSGSLDLVNEDPLVAILMEPLVGVAHHDASLKVFPNPTNGILNIESSSGSRGHLTLMDISGKILVQKVMLPGKNTIDLSSLRNGLFLLRIQTPGGTVIQKISRI